MPRNIAFFVCFFTFLVPSAALSQSAAIQIDWEVANRFRLFAEQKEFDRHVEAMKADPGQSILAAEHKLVEKFGGRGWGDSMGALCFDSFRGRILETCKRDGVNETYLNPPSIRIKLRAKLPADFGAAVCDWTIGPVNIAQTVAGQNCNDSINDARALTYRPTPITVVARNQSGVTLQGRIEVQVRDVFIVGMGDSIASGEGNPSRPIRLDTEGFCFRRPIFGASQIFSLPGRANTGLIKACDNAENTLEARETWDAHGASWLYNACHRSLYSYQMRTALALAIQNPKISVTFLPLGCTGAEIGEGILESMPPREREKKAGVSHPAVVEAQISQLRNYLRSITNAGRRRPIDLLLLTIGANDIGFSGLVANIIINENPERSALKGTLVTPEEAAENLKELRGDFRLLRRQLLPIMGADLSRVVFVAYGNPGSSESGTPCGDGKTGFDVHPAFAVDGATLKQTAKFVDDVFLPTLKNYVTCSPNGGCARPQRDAMKFIDGHFSQFSTHGFCAKSGTDPEFDKQCFKDGGSFQTLAKPLACQNFVPSQFEPYAKRARWVRTANDSYFSAMTYPWQSGVGADPIDLHDARWGLTSVVYGGAVHPTAEGHAAMADAALPAARDVLGLAQPTVNTAAR